MYKYLIFLLVLLLYFNQSINSDKEDGDSSTTEGDNGSTTNDKEVATESTTEFEDKPFQAVLTTEHPYLNVRNISENQSFS